MVREALGIGMSGHPALTYTTNVIFRCPDFVSLHDKGKGYRFIFIGPGVQRGDDDPYKLVIIVWR